MGNMNWNNVSFCATKKRNERMGRNGLVGDFYNNISQYDSVMVNWLNESDKNKEAFVKDPIGCFKKVANPDKKVLQIIESVNKLEDKEVEAMFLEENENDELIPCVNSDRNDMHGWDIVSSVRADAINNILKYAMDKSVLPKHFSKDITFEFFSQKIQIHFECEVGAPYICGGTGEVVETIIPVKYISVDGKEYHLLSDTGVKVKLKLDQVYNDRGGDEGDFIFYINFGQEFVYGIDFVNLPPDLEKEKQVVTILANAIKDAVAEIIDEHSRVEICKVAKSAIEEKYRFLLPNKVYYIFRGEEKEAAISILVQTVSSEPGERYVDAHLIPDGSDGCVMISNRLFMENTIKPSLVSAMKIAPDKLSIRKLDDKEGAYQIYNNGKFDMQEIKGYIPSVKKFNFDGYDDSFHISLDADIVPTAGIDLNLTADGTYTPYFEAVSGGKQQFALKEKKFTTNHEVNIEWWVYTVAALTALVTLFISGVFIAAVVAGIAFGVIGIIDAVVDSKAGGGITSQTILDVADGVKWEHADVVSLESINVNPNVLVGLKMRFLTS